MKTIEILLKKYCSEIIWFILIYIIFFILKPTQESYYWKSDIDLFKENVYLKISIIISLFFIIAYLCRSLYKKENPMKILTNTVFLSITFTWFFFFLQIIIIPIVLFINRSYENKTIIRKFEVIRIDDNQYIYAIEKNNRGYHLNQTEFEEHPNYIKTDKLRKDQIIDLQFKKGLFGINYFEK